ncbi:MAG: hypothetical protein Q9183_002743 [Haloplaca sp. 2 TL-2023]
MAPPQQLHNRRTRNYQRRAEKRAIRRRRIEREADAFARGEVELKNPSRRQRRYLGKYHPEKFLHLAAEGRVENSLEPPEDRGDMENNQRDATPDLPDYESDENVNANQQESAPATARPSSPISSITGMRPRVGSVEATPPSTMTHSGRPRWRKYMPLADRLEDFIENEFDRLTSFLVGGMTSLHAKTDARIDEIPAEVVHARALAAENFINNGLPEQEPPSYEQIPQVNREAAAARAWPELHRRV